MKAFQLVLLICTITLTSSAQNKSFDHKWYSFQYDDSWSIDTDDPDYNPDSYFAIDASEGGVFILSIVNEKIDEHLVLEEYINSFKKGLLKEPDSETPISSWGIYTGKGMLLKGSHLGAPISVRLFCWSEGNRTFAMVAQMNEADKKKLGAGFALIEKSFRVKK